MADRYFTTPLFRRAQDYAPPIIEQPYHLPVETIDPIHLTAVATDVFAGADAGANALALKNTTPYPMEIHEIKFDLVSTAASIHGGMIGCRLDFGEIAITNGFVPFLSFGRALNLAGAEILNDNCVLPATPYRSREYVWRLPQPIYVPPTGVIVPAFKNFGYSQTALDVRVSYSGRLLPKGYTPPSYKMPWVTAYVSKVFNVGPSADSDSSDENALSNPFDTDVFVQRFIGRTAGYNPDAASIPTLDHADSVARLLRVRMDDSSGDPLIPNFSPFSAIFPLVLRGAWDVNAVIRPCSYFMAYLDLIAAATGNDYAPAVQNQSFISLVGWRTIKGY